MVQHNAELCLVANRENPSGLRPLA